MYRLFHVFEYTTEGLSMSISAARPAGWGKAIDIPLHVRYSRVGVLKYPIARFAEEYCEHR